jgi:hypothetical protein
MMSQAPFVRPPRIAAWLVDLLTPYEQAESIHGDLLEEFSDLASKLGVASARRWYWRQSAKTIVYLIGTGFRVAPWSILGIVIGAYLLIEFGYSLPEQAIVGVIHLRRHHVTPYYDTASLATYVLWLDAGILIGRLLISLVIGSIAALAAKGREMIATMTLSLLSPAVLAVLSCVSVVRHQPLDLAFLPNIMVHQFGRAFMIVIGGVIVRESRSAMSRRPAAAGC